MTDGKHTPPAAMTWSAFEHDHVERGADWYWALAVAAVALALTSLLFHDLFFGVLILLAAYVIALMAQRPPEIIHFALSERGVRTGDTMHKFEEIISFWVEDHDVKRPLLLVDTTKFMSPNLIIPIENVDPHAVRTYLRERCDEVPMKEPVTHKIFEYFGL